jgi:hypothetical protein
MGMAFRVRAVVLLGVAAVAIFESAAPSLAADTFANVKIEFDAATLAGWHEDTATPAAKWIDLDSATALLPVSQNAGMIGFDKPILNMPDGSTATLNLGARAGAIRAGITWNLD